MNKLLTGARAPRVYVPMTGSKLIRWLLFYLALVLLDVARLAFPQLLIEIEATAVA